MPAVEYPQGQTVTFWLRVRNPRAAGHPGLDPITVTLKIKRPDNTTLTRTLSGATVIHDGDGHFHVDEVLTQAGTWSWRWETTAPAVVKQGQLGVAAALV